MRVLVLGGGVIGVTTAYYLAKQGYAVTVLERQAATAEETSFGNAGQISPGYASPWAAPHVPLAAIKWMLQQHAPLTIKLTKDSAQYLWMAKMLRQCTAGRYQINKARMVRLAEYSRDCLDELRNELGLAYEGRQLGGMQLFRSQQQLDTAAADIRILQQFGVPYQLLSPEQILQYEPGLVQSVTKLSGALRLPNDQTGDCNLFTKQLTERARELGVEFKFGQQVERLQVEGQQVTGVYANGQLLSADRYVVALGSYSPLLLKPLGIQLPVYPLKGYSLTLPIVQPEQAPEATVIDETYKVAITRFEQRIRVGGFAELSGYNLALNPERKASMSWVINDLYPGAGDLQQALFWTGLRPATPDGTPVIGATPYTNLLLNTGHGTLGWTMACGSAHYLADLMANRAPAIDTEGLSIFRYR
ncbi:D-amino acid dehydrogenase [Thiopseudomonas alkaliphila]|uniref:D-amino acid dehydrogenase n=1 Tax=Thiopseudomonas alkaliphila TaxID=1697053 RepID=UPI0025791BF1|nr:D-amino acid dehydrogenase [Thiopseudomonas alkaliphila]MDM1716521.1 D-amino acid dehydrogenase [Thiopseudomonas alkaliphila]